MAMFPFYYLEMNESMECEMQRNLKQYRRHSTKNSDKSVSVIFEIFNSD